MTSPMDNINRLAGFNAEMHYLELDEAGKIDRKDMYTGPLAGIINAIKELASEIFRWFAGGSTTDVITILNHLITQLDDLKNQSLTSEERVKLLVILMNLGQQLSTYQGRLMGKVKEILNTGIAPPKPSVPPRIDTPHVHAAPPPIANRGHPHSSAGVELTEEEVLQLCMHLPSNLAELSKGQLLVVLRSTGKWETVEFYGIENGKILYRDPLNPDKIKERPPTPGCYQLKP